MTTDYWAPQFERTVAWNDKDVGISWPLDGAPILSVKDGNATPFALSEYFP